MAEYTIAHYWKIHKRSLKREKERKIAKDLHDIGAISSGHQNIQIENNIQIVCEIWRTINGKKAPGKKKGGGKDMISSLTSYINYFSMDTIEMNGKIDDTVFRFTFSQTI